MLMKTSEKMKTQMRQFEGCRLDAYKDAVGVLTIGYGHTGSDVTEGQTITLQRAAELFDSDLEKFEKGVEKLTAGVTIKQCQFDALVSFSYNVGTNALKTSTLLRKLLKDPDDKTIRAEFMRWDVAKGRILPGLTKRRKFEADFYFGVFE